MHQFTPEETKAVLAFAATLDRRGGEGDVIFRIETAAGCVAEGHVIAIDVEDAEEAADGVLLGGMPPDNAHHLVKFDEIVWIGIGFLK